MAYEVKDEEQNNPNAAPLTLNAPGTAPTASSPAAPSAPSSPSSSSSPEMSLGPSSGVVSGSAPQAASKSSASPGFTNLQQYLDANQEQTKGLAHQISDPIQQQADQAQSQANSAFSNFQDQVKQGSTPLDSGLLDSLQMGGNFLTAEQKANENLAQNRPGLPASLVGHGLLPPTRPPVGDVTSSAPPPTFTIETPQLQNFVNNSATPKNSSASPMRGPGLAVRPSTSINAASTSSSSSDQAGTEPPVFTAEPFSQLPAGSGAPTQNGVEPWLQNNGGVYTPPPFVEKPAPQTTTPALQGIEPWLQGQAPLTGVNPATLTPDQTSEIQKMLHASYQGPQSIEATGLLQPALDQASQAKTLADLTQNEGGRFSLLNQFVSGSQPYTAGEKTLDQALLGLSPAAQQTFSDLRTNVDPLTQQFENQAANVNSLVDPAKQLTTNTATQTSAALQQAYQDRLKALQGLVGDFSKDQTSELQNLQKELDATKILNPNVLDPRGEAGYQALTGNQFNPQDYLDVNLYPVDPSQYAQLNSAQASLGNVTTADQLAQLNALAQLQGVAQNDITDTSQLGTYKPGASANTSAYQNAVESKLHDLQVQGQIGSFLQGQTIPVYNADLGITNDELARGLITQPIRSFNQLDYLSAAQPAFQQSVDAENSLRQSLGFSPLNYQDLPADQIITHPDPFTNDYRQGYQSLENAYYELQNELNQEQSGLYSPDYFKSYFAGGPQKPTLPSSTITVAPLNYGLPGGITNAGPVQLTRDDES